MTTAANVRFSRDGDRFHYNWAAVRSLKLLDADGPLAAITVEGASDVDAGIKGEEVIDLAEYYGAANLAECTAVRFIQVKHSTSRVDKHVTASELRKTLADFAKNYRELSSAGHSAKVQYGYVTNRRLADNVRKALTTLADVSAPPAATAPATTLRGYLNFGADRAAEADFCQRLTIEDESQSLRELEGQLERDLASVLPGTTTPSMLRLRDEIARMATSLAESNELNRTKLLLTLGVSADRMFPADNTIRLDANTIETSQLPHLLQEAINGDATKVLVTASGGMGKTTVAAQLGRHLPDGSVAVLFDCFAGGDYRSATKQRHTHASALTQLSNELAMLAGCAPLVPTNAQPADYVIAFMVRVQQVAERLALRSPDAKLIVLIDAADNAASWAGELNERAFSQDLFNESWPENTRLIQFCRPERAHLLQAPPDVKIVELRGFSEAESTALLRTRFTHATDAQGAEMHEQTSGVPRVQAMAMENAESVHDALQALRIANDAPGDTLDALLAKQIQTVAHQQNMDQDELLRLCQALAGLHPRMPISSLAGVAEVEPGTITSFAADLGRGLHQRGDTLQFRDEPTETWFRTNHRPTGQALEKFVDQVARFAVTDHYLARSLPQLLFEAERFDELVDLAMSDAQTPGGLTDVDSQEIVRERTRFALAATLKKEMPAQACLLSLRAGQLEVGHNRRLQLFRSNADLVGRLLETASIESLCASTDLAHSWPGSHLLTEAAIRSCAPALKDGARGPLRSSTEIIDILVRQTAEKRRSRRDIEQEHIAEAALTHLNLDGPEAAVIYLTKWRAWVVEFSTDWICSRLADNGRFDEIEQLVTASSSLPAVGTTAAATFYNHSHVPREDVTKALVDAVRRDNRDKDDDKHDRALVRLRSRTWIAVLGLAAGVLNADEAMNLLSAVTPKHVPNSFVSHSVDEAAPMLTAMAVLARISGRDLDYLDIAGDRMRKELEKSHSQSEWAREYADQMPLMVAWAVAYAGLLIQRTEADAATFNDLLDELLDPESKSPRDRRLRTISEFALRGLLTTDDEARARRFGVLAVEHHNLLSRVRTTLIRLGARNPHLHQMAIKLGSLGAEKLTAPTTSTEDSIDELVETARALLPLSESEARALFNLAAAASDQLGDDLLARIDTLMQLGRRMATGQERRRAYRLAQIVERLDQDVELSPDMVSATLRGMSPTFFAAQASRWRDRRTFTLASTLDDVVNDAVQGKASRASLALKPFLHEDSRRVTTGNLPPEDQALVEAAFADFARYEHTYHRPSKPESSNRPWSLTDDDDDQQTPEQLAAATDFTTADGWDAALAALEYRMVDQRALYGLALDKHQITQADVIRAFGQALLPDLRDVADFVKLLSTRDLTVAGRQARDDLVLTAVERFATSLSTADYYSDTDLIFVANGPLTEAELTKHALKHAAAKVSSLRHRSYFHLAGRIGTVLEVEDVRPAFDLLASMFDDVAPAGTSADGAYDTFAQEPDAWTECLAGVIWAALGDVAVATRWDAAYATLLLARLNATAELEALARYATGDADVTPFVDARLPFYEMHAQLWLLIALGRATLDPDPSAISPFAAWMASVVQGPPHAANQVIAQRALRALTAHAAELTQDPSVREALDRNLQPATVPDDRADIIEKKRQLRQQERDDERAPYFYIDFEPYWCDDLARAFITTERDIAKRAAKVIDDHFPHRYPRYDSGHEDPRRTFDVYGRESTVPYKSKWPSEDGLGFYLSLHALLRVGAELAATSPVVHDPQLDDDEYTEWLAQFLPNRRDGRWLSDRRDQPPLPPPDYRIPDPDDRPNWRWGLSKSDFESIVDIGQDWVTVWSSSTAANEGYSEYRTVSTALVPNATARALLAAMETASGGGMTFTIPSLQEEEDPDYGPSRLSIFHLKAWIDESHRYYGLDTTDDRGGDINYPPPRPTDEVAATFNLAPDDDMRAWRDPAGEALRSQVWKDMRNLNGSSGEGSEGHILKARVSFLIDLLTHYDRTLVFQVGIQRHFDRSYQSRQDDDDDELYTQWSHKAYLLDQNGSWFEH